eukprot:361917-Chlamydomonas_euryale.AAC.3
MAPKQARACAACPVAHSKPFRCDLARPLPVPPLAPAGMFQGLTSLVTLLGVTLVGGERSHGHAFPSLQRNATLLIFGAPAS